MWYCILFLLVGAALADHHHAWETGQEYHFHMQSRTLTALENLHNQFSGILMKGVFTVQVKSLDTLQATVYKPQYASIHEVLSAGWDSEIPDQSLKFQALPLSAKPFEIKIKHGVIRDLLVPPDMPTWEVNVLKSIVSQLQIDTQGENAIRSDSTQVPNDEQPFAMFKAMEDSVGGKCEVLYDITPLSEDVRLNYPELIPLPGLGNGLHFDITKTKNYTRCEQRMAYNFGISGGPNWKPGSSDELLSRLSTSRIVISGDLKHFTIQSSVTTNKIFASSTIQESFSGVVYSRMNLTLDRISKISDAMFVPDNLVSTGNLVYMYNSPFSDHEQRTPRRPSISRSSLPVQSSESRSNSSSEESHSDDDSSSSSSSSSSASNSEERDYLQPKPKLDEVPNNPLLPYFVGYRGKSIQKAENDYVAKVASLIGQIGLEIEHFSTMNSKQPETLEKFTILIRLIRTMNSKQIAQVKDMLTWTNLIMQAPSDEEKKSLEQIMWNVYRDAVAEAGTGPALITIKNWIKNKKLEDMEAAQVVSIISKAARTPTAEYIKAFYEMIIDPDVLSQDFLNATAPVVFADLVRKAYISRSYYPEYSFGRMIPKQDSAMIETYIPYMADQLRKAIKDADSPRIQTYITALGNFGYPKILSIYEPYLEGAQPITKFQRMLMVASLNRLTETAPRVVRPVLYKIYLNVMEAPEVRCVAVYLLMKTNPPLNMLQRMAEFTNHLIDENRQVNSAVKSSIESLANSKKPELQGLANKARIVKKLLTSERYNKEYSRRVSKERLIPSLNMAYRFDFDVIGNDNSDTSKIINFVMDTSYGGFNLPSSRITSAISNIRPLQSMWQQSKEADAKENLTEKIARALNIQSKDPEQFEGNYFVNMYGMQFFPFDNHTLERIQKMLQKYAIPTPNPMVLSGSMNNLVSYDATLGFPTESGLPFLCTLRIPKIERFSGEASYHMKFSDSLSLDARVAGHMVQDEKIQSRIGFITPFDYKHYIAGIDINTQMYVPIDLDVNWEPAKKRIDIKIRKEKCQHDMLFNFSIVPYTAMHNILSLEPVLLDKETRIVYTKEPHVVEVGSTGIYKITAKSDNLDSEAWQKLGYSAYNEIFIKMWAEPLRKAHYKKLDVSLSPIEQDINVSYNSIEIDGDSSNQQSSPTIATVPAIVDKTPNSEARQKQFLKEVSKDIKSATAYVFDISYIPKLPPSFIFAIHDVQYVFTIAVADSNVDEKSRALFYWNAQSPERMFSEICAAGQMQSSQNILLDFEKAIEQLPKDEFSIEFTNCDEAGEKFLIQGNATRSDDFKKVVMDSEIVQKCQQEMKQGNKGLRACQQATKLAGWRDHVMVSMDLEFKLEILNIANAAILQVMSKKLPEENIDLRNPRNAGKNTIDMEIKLLSLEIKNTEISLYTSEADIKFSLSDIVESSEEEKDDNLLIVESEEEDEASCTVDKTQVVTFDDKVYPLKLGKCWHVMMITLPQRDPVNFNKSLTIPKELRVAVKVREVDDGNKEVQMIFGERIIHLQKSGDHLEAAVNGHKIEYSQHTSHQEKEDDKIIFEIFELPDGSIRVISDEYEVKAVYDGERIRLGVSDEYCNVIRGLCGTYDKRSSSDFTTPKNCILTKPEEFTATYAMTQDNCQGPALENKQKAEQSTCVQMSYRQSNVINERGLGRPSIERKNWGYH